MIIVLGQPVEEPAVLLASPKQGAIDQGERSRDDDLFVAWSNDTVDHDCRHRLSKECFSRRNEGYGMHKCCPSRQAAHCLVGLAVCGDLVSLSSRIRLVPPSYVYRAPNTGTAFGSAGRPRPTPRACERYVMANRSDRELTQPAKRPRCQSCDVPICYA